MPERVYVETTIFSFYHDERTSPEVLAMRHWTREWWDHHSQRYELITSAAVLAELERGTLPHRDRALTMAAGLPAVPIEPQIPEIVSVYIEHKVMPADPVGDALHLALASVHKADYLVTWNCRHLANANKFAHIRRTNALLRLAVPELVTPLELTGEVDLP
ncbi:MAG: type II toxin-antitoxin system VapC family toxin [Candidatus Brocadiia bacterium]